MLTVPHSLCGTRLLHLDLGENRGLVIEKDAFVSMYRLQNLSLSYTNNTKTHGTLFYRNKNLKTLLLNKIKFLKNVTISMFNHLVVLSNLAVCCNIHHIENNSFLELRNLLSLSLRNNRITGISSQIFNGLYQLETLTLESNEITEIAEFAFKQLRKLNTLNLSNQIRTVLFLSQTCVLRTENVFYRPL